MSGQSNLRKTLKFKDVLILAFSTMIGWGWVTLTGPWVASGGALGATLAFLVGALLCVFVGLTYCELTPMLPYAGGELVFAYKAMGYHASWFTGWMITFAYVGVAAWEGPALATAIDYIVEIPKIGYLYTVAGFDVYISWLLIPAIVGGLLMYINFKGVNVSATFQAIVTVILALGGIGLAVCSVFVGSSANFTPLVTDTRGVFTVILAVPAMFVGFDVIPQAAEEMNLSIKKIPKAIIASISLAATWYIVMILSAAFLAPADVLNQEGVSVVNAMNYAMKTPIAGKLIIVTAIMGILTSWNGFIIGATRVLYAMGRARMLPKIFGSLHPKHHSPYFATIFVGLITILTPLLGKNSLLWFVNSSAFGTVLAYFMVSVSFVVLRITQPKLERPYKVKGGLIIGCLAVIISLFFISLYLPIGPSSLIGIEWIICLSWTGMGLIMYLASLKNKNKYANEREKSLFGDN